MKDIDFLLAGGEIFALVVYAQLLLENARLYEVDSDLVDQIFDFMVRDVAKHAVGLLSKPITTAAQMDYCTKMIRRPVADPARYARVWEQYVAPLSGAYEMRR